jgi:hypothetical protein
LSHRIIRTGSAGINFGIAVTGCEKAKQPARDYKKDLSHKIMFWLMNNK